MRNRFSDVIARIAEKDKKIYIVVADISPAGAMERFRKKNPDRFINVGVAEQTMISVCAGLAMRGMKPFAYTISTFALYRPFEMIRTDLCYQNLPVTVVGMGAGTIYSSLGATHLTLEDISISRSVPNFQVISPCDPDELEESLKFCVSKSKKPTYLRIGKSGEKSFKSKEKWKFGKIRNIFKGESICLLFYGPILNLLNDKLEFIKKRKVSTYSCHTLKPFDYKGLKKIFKKYKNIIILEDHSEIGGLSSIVKEASHDFKYSGKIKTFSLRDKFLKSYESQNDLLEKHGISSKNIISYLRGIK